MENELLERMTGSLPSTAEEEAKSARQCMRFTKVEGWISYRSENMDRLWD
jgi:hypothetical protein